MDLDLLIGEYNRFSNYNKKKWKNINTSLDKLQNDNTQGNDISIQVNIIDYFLIQNLHFYKTRKEIVFKLFSTHLFWIPQNIHHDTLKLIFC